MGISADALARSAKRMRRVREALDCMAGNFIQHHAELNDAGFCRIDASAFRGAPEDIALRVMARVLQGIGGQVSPPRLVKLEKLVEMLMSGAVSQTLGGCQIVPEDDDILILRESGRRRESNLVLKPGECGLWDNRYRVRLDPCSSAPVQVRALGKSGYGEVRARLGEGSYPA